MNRILLVLLIIPVSLRAQTNRYFVSFRNKANSVYSVSNPLQFLSQKSIDRRVRENFTTTDEDFPVNKSYVQQVKATGAEVYFTSRWFNGLLVQTTPAIATVIGNLSCVSNVELVGWGKRLTGGRIKSNEKLEQLNGVSSVRNSQQLSMLGLDQMHSEGFHGEGIDVAVFDAGFIGVNTVAAFQPIFAEGRLKDAFNFVTNSTDVYSIYFHGSWVLSIMAGEIAGQFEGGASKANYYLYLTEDVFTEYRVEEYNWLFAAEKADSAGVDVINSSLGYYQFDDITMDYSYKDLNGKTSVVARAAHKAFERGIVIVNSAGNEGNNSWKYIISPADALGVISCAAVDAGGTHAYFSSIGPSSDGRVKPDVSSLGYGSVVIDTDGSISQGNGTSFSSPLVASLAIGLRQALPNASAAEIYNRIINSASQADHPDYFIGYGIPDFDRAKSLTDNLTVDFEAYPNPATNLLKVLFKNPDGSDVNTILFNSAGQKVFERTFSATWADNPLSIDVSSFARGLYYLRVQTGTSSKVTRLLTID